MFQVSSKWSTMLVTVLMMASGVLFMPAQTAYAATITVTTTVDEINTNAVCSLREAVRAANTNAKVGACVAGSSTTVDIISVPAGTYTLTRTGAAENAAATGDLDLLGSVRIVGANTTTTIIDGNASDRLIDVRTGATATLTKLTLRNGTQTSGFMNGGGAWNNGTLTLDQVVVTGNSAGNYGGGVFNSVGRSLTLSKSTVSNNAAAYGGGISNDGEMTISFSTIKNNAATWRGGGIRNTGTLRVGGSTLNGNQAVNSYGGGLVNTTSDTGAVGTATFQNTTVSGNTSAADGAGIDNVGTLQLLSSTVTQNSGPVGGIWGSITLANTIVAGNSGSNPDCFGTVSSQGYNLIGNTSGCTIAGDATGNKLNVAANLGPLQNNGGRTLTHALLSGSPAIDAGNPATPGIGGTTCPATDQRQVARPQDGNNDGIARCDMGAYELQISSVSGGAVSPMLVPEESLVTPDVAAPTPPSTGQAPPAPKAVPLAP